MMISYSSGVSRPFSGNVSGIISYGYDMHGWPTGITTNSFCEELFYADGLGTPCYNGNQLSDVEEDALELQYTGSFDYKGSRGSQYGYNENGSLLFDKSRNIAYITYDVSNNPKQIYYTNGNVTRYSEIE